jgi:hypothetical protein
MVTVLGIVTVVAVVTVWLVRRQWTQYVIGATVAFPQTAGLIIGDNGFPLFYLATIVLLVLAIPHLLAALARQGAQRGSRTRLAPDLIGVALVMWGGVITFAGPRIFSGMRVFAPALGVDAQVENMAILAPSLGNTAQFGYLAFGVGFLLLAGRTFPVDSRLIGSALWVSIVLSGVRMIAEPAWPHDLLQNMPSFHYATAERLSGTFYEPSVLGLYLVAAAGYFTAKLFESGWRTRLASVAALALVAVEFLANASGTALLGLVVLAVIAALVVLVRQLRAARVTVRPWAIAGSVAALAVALAQLPLLYQLTIGTASNKSDSLSFTARTASNLRAWHILLESSGLGVGLGSNRPSSLFFLVLSCLGVVGIGLLAALVFLALARGLKSHSPAAWGLAGVVVAAVIAVPDLSMPVIWVGLAACLFPARAAEPQQPSARPLTEFLSGATRQ